MQTALDTAREIAVTLGVPLALGIAWAFLGVLKAHGYRTTYAAALLRAVGQGQIAAQERGVSLFSPAGRAIAARAGSEYLMSTVGGAGEALGIVGEAQNAARVVGQIGAMQAAAEAAAQPPLTRVPSDTMVPANLNRLPPGTPPG